MKNKGIFSAVLRVPALHSMLYALCSLLLLALCSPPPAAAFEGYHVDSLAALAAIDGKLLSTSDVADVYDSGTAYRYRLNATSGAAPSSPGIISPTKNAGTKRWILQMVTPAQGGTGVDSSAATGYPSLSSGTWSFLNSAQMKSALGYFTSADFPTSAMVKTNGSSRPGAATADVDYVTPSGTGTLANKTHTAPVINGGIANNTYSSPPYVDGSVAPTTGSVAALNATPTNGGSNWTTGDLFNIATGSGDAIGKCTTAVTGSCTVAALVDSGTYAMLTNQSLSAYSTGTGQATSKNTCTNSGCTGLTVNVTAVGLTAPQVWGTVIGNTGQAASAVTAPLPTIHWGVNFTLQGGTAQTSQAWSFSNSPGILNGASGDLIYLNGAAGTAGSSHGVQILSPTVGATMNCGSIKTAVSPAVYSLACSPVSGAFAAY